MNKEKIEQYWREFLDKTHRDKSLTYFECFSFGWGEEMGDELLALVLQGKKRATASSLLAYQQEGERLPQVGDFSIVTDGKGSPRCVIETTTVTIIPFKDITFDICKREGEDEVLETWQQGHERLFTKEGKELGYEFTWDMQVVFEDFAVVYET